MKTEDWARKYRAALMEQIPVLQRLRCDEANVAVMGRMKELGETSDERALLPFSKRNGQGRLG